MQHQVLLNDPDLVVWSDVEVISESCRRVNAASRESLPIVTNRKSGNIFQDLLWGNYIIASTMMLARDAACEVGFCEELRYLSDYRFIVDIAFRHRFLWIGVPPVYCRLHSGGTQQASPDEHSQDLPALSRYFLEQYGHEMPKHLRRYLRLKGSIWYCLFLRIKLKISPVLLPPGSRLHDLYVRTSLPRKYLIQGNPRKFPQHMLGALLALFRSSTPERLDIKDHIPQDDADHTPESQLRISETYDGSGYGEEWNASEEWKMSVIDEVMNRNIPPGRTILEVGSGAGR